MPGKWHNDMENNFPEDMREIKFFCASRIYNTSRRTDILLNNNRTCEIQHSPIYENEIVSRFNDWNKFGKEIIWLIDGNEGIELDKLSTGNYILIFKQKWKYKSFINTYDFILIEKDGLVFKIELNKIRCGMIELKDAKPLLETIDYLKKTPEKIWDYWSDDNVIKSVLGVYQQGAGNGKTYGIWRSIIENVDRKTYIIVTKQHSAKTVIYEELKDQKKRFENGEEHHIEFITNENQQNTHSHFVIKYTHKKSKRECVVIIGTIDSLCYNLTDSNTNGSNFFKSIIDNIKENGATKIKEGYLIFGGQRIQLSKECEIWIDEVQDLPENYLYAMLKLMYETSCYINVVGDKLQSLEYSDNFLTNIIKEGLPNIEIDEKTHINKNRRIKVTNMGNKINELIDFNRFNLPIIECDTEIPKENNKEPIKIIESPTIYANDTDDNKVSDFCDKIIHLYKDEVETNNYSPNDFLIISPIMKSNIIAEELQTKIQEYWSNKYNDDEYIQYVYLHKHTEGTVINTSDSINATRIMSIRSSKGDGRNVVFVLNINEESLKLVSNNEIGLVYESHLHVALTRAKKQIYFGLVKNNDNIHKRFGDTGYVEYLPNINKKIKLDKINDFINKDIIIELLNNNNINELNDIIEEETTIEQSETVDWGYHCIKYYTFYYNVILNIINNKNTNVSNKKSHLFVKLKIISRYHIYPKTPSEFHKLLNEVKFKDLEYFPLCKLSNKPEYTKYYRIIEKTMLKIQKYIKDNKLNELNVYESIILTYMIEIETNRKYAGITIVEIYNITDYFQKNNNKEKILLNNIKNVKNIINKSGITDYQNMNWNIFKKIELDSKYDYFTVHKCQFPIIGNNDTDIIHIVLKSNISKLNFWDSMIEILLERFIIYNPKSEEDKTKFENKKINTYLFLLDKNSFIKIDWEWDKKLFKDIKNELKLVLENYYENNHSDIYKYFTHIKNKNIEGEEDINTKILDVIIQKCKDMYSCPDYIIDFFKDIQTKIDDEEEYDYINLYDTFNTKLKKKMNTHINKYLN
tara:strand:- start:1017 stop:4112 length:3096 start_codon:yes stop_codon:yes gene_type:complete